MDSYSQIVFPAFLQETLKVPQAGNALCSVYLHVYCCFLRAWWHGEKVVSKTRYFFVLRLVTVDPGVNTAEEGTRTGDGADPAVDNFPSPWEGSGSSALDVPRS